MNLHWEFFGWTKLAANRFEPVADSRETEGYNVHDFYPDFQAPRFNSVDEALIHLAGNYAGPDVDGIAPELKLVDEDGAIIPFADDGGVTVVQIPTEQIN